MYQLYPSTPFKSLFEQDTLIWSYGHTSIWFTTWFKFALVFCFCILLLLFWQGKCWISYFKPVDISLVLIKQWITVVSFRRFGHLFVNSGQIWSSDCSNEICYTLKARGNITPVLNQIFKYVASVGCLRVFN